MLIEETSLNFTQHTFVPFAATSLQKLNFHRYYIAQKKQQGFEQTFRKFSYKLMHYVITKRIILIIVQIYYQMSNQFAKTSFNSNRKKGGRSLDKILLTKNYAHNFIVKMVKTFP